MMKTSNKQKTSSMVVLVLLLISYSCSNSPKAKPNDSTSKDMNVVQNDSMEVDFGDGVQYVNINDTGNTMKYITFNYLNPKPIELEEVQVNSKQFVENDLSIIIADSGNYLFRTQLNKKKTDFKIRNVSKFNLPFLYFTKCFKHQNPDFTTYFFIYNIMIPNTFLIEKNIFTILWDKRNGQLHFIELDEKTKQYSFSKFAFSDINSDGFVDLVNLDFNKGDGSYLVLNSEKWTYTKQDCFDLSEKEENLYLVKSFKKVDCK